jgi:hypothetical protein
MLPVLSYGAEGKEFVDLEKYHKLQTSSVYFSSVKGKPFHVGIGFNKHHREMYFRGKISHDKILGYLTIYSLSKKEKPVKIYLKEGYWNDVWMNTPIKNAYFIMEYMQELKVGEYLIVPNVYISKDIPSDLNNIVMVSEKTTWK